jgi:hypothetical protein
MTITDKAEGSSTIQHGQQGHFVDARTRWQSTSA